jgi:hypothetical protein
MVGTTEPVWMLWKGEKISSPTPKEWNPDFSAIQHIAHHHTDWAIAVSNFYQNLRTK